MPSTDRRSLLASLSTLPALCLAGCSVVQSTRPPAGSLRFENDDRLPHAITVRVVDVGSEPGEEPGSTVGTVTVPPAQRTLTASTTVAPGERLTYEEVFTESVWYAVQFEVDGLEPADDAGTTTFHPTPPGRESGRFLSGTVFQSGDFSWGIGGTDDLGRFAR